MNHRLLCLVMSVCAVSCSSKSKTGPALANPPVVSLAGNKTALLQVESTSPWKLTSDQPWLTVSAGEGKTASAVTVTADRSGLAPGNYQASLTLTVDGATKKIPVFMRFPLITGNINAHAGKRAAFVPSFNPAQVDPDKLELTLEPGAVALAQGKEIALETDPAPSDEDYLAVAQQLATDHKLTIQTQLGGIFYMSAGGQTLPELIATLVKDGRVASASPINKEFTHAVPNDPLYAQQWHYPLINLPAAWDITTGSANIPLAIVDSGIEITHPDLQSRVIAGYDFSQNTDVMTDKNGHGTHCAGTVGAVSNEGVGVAGVTWLNPLMPVRVLGDDGTGSGADISRGLIFASGLSVTNGAGTVVQAARPARVINASLGANDPQCTGNPRPSPTQAALVKRLEAQGTILVFAAGNDGPCNVINEWGAIPGVISVTAVGPDGQRAPYSTAGSDAWIAAPGGLSGGAPNGVLSTYTNNTTSSIEGTSMAAPHVAGVIGLMLAVNPQLSPVDVRTILARTATPIVGADAASSGSPTQRGGMGHGLVNAQAAVQAAQTWTPTQSNFRAQLVDQAGTVVQNVAVDQGGNFAMRSAGTGSFKLRVGSDTDNDGVLGESGEDFDEESLTVGDDDDTEYDAALQYVP